MIKSDEGFLLSKFKYNENSIIADFYTKTNGKISGIIFGGTSKKIKGYLQVGNFFHLNINSKNETKVSSINVEIIKPYTVISLPHISQIHVFYLAKLLSDSFGPTNESSEVKLVEISKIPWDELAFPTVSMTLKYFVEDSKKDNFEFREEEILLS